MKDIEIKQQMAKYIKEYFTEYGIDDISIYGKDVMCDGYIFFVLIDFFDRQNRKDVYQDLKYEAGIHTEIISIIEIERKIDLPNIEEMDIYYVDKHVLQEYREQKELLKKGDLPPYGEF